MHEIEEVEEVVEVARIGNLRGRKRKIFKLRNDPFQTYNETEFRKKYRFTKDGVRFLIETFGGNLSDNRKGGGISPSLKILTALRYWGRNEIQDDAADLHGFSQQSITNVCKEVAEAILQHRQHYIKMPSTVDEEFESMRKFRLIAGFKGVIGAIDCTHIRIPAIGGDMGQFYINRKNYTSLNVQVVCDASMKINNIIAHWRGSTHDSRIFNESNLKQQFENGVFHGRLLGDSGYACTPYLFTPLLNPATRKERSYNQSHIATRNVVERCFGLWKNRFLCLLRGFRTSLENTKMYIVTLAILHNIAIELREEQFNDEDLDAEQHEQLAVNIRFVDNQRGVAARAMFIEENF